MILVMSGIHHGPSVLATRQRLTGRARGRVESTCYGGHSLIAKLSESRRRLVVLENAMPCIVLVENHPDRGIERRRQLMPRHQRGRHRIANVVLERITCFARYS